MKKEDFMKKVAVLVSIAFIIGIFCVPAFAFDKKETIVKADEAYDKGTMAGYKEAKKLLAPFLGKDEEATWKFARASYQIGIRTTDKTRRKAIFEKSFLAVEKYIDAGSTVVGTNYWYALNAGQYGKLKGIIKSLFLVKPMKKACKNVLRKDPGFEDGSAYTVLGAIEYEVPGGDLDLCISYCKKKLPYDKGDMTANLYLAKTYYKKKDYTKAKKYVETAINNNKYPKTASDKEDLAEAKELLKKVKAKLAN
jgi:tetratricopeptide (TPR) repeat protein